VFAVISIGYVFIVTLQAYFFGSSQNKR
jgi:hypothetical protein